MCGVQSNNYFVTQSGPGLRKPECILLLNWTCSVSTLEGSAFSFHCLEVWLVHFWSNFVVTKCVSTLHVNVQELKIHWTFLVNIPSPHLLGSHFTRQYNVCILSKISTFLLFSTALREIKCIVNEFTAFFYIFLCCFCVFNVMVAIFWDVRGSH